MIDFKKSVEKAKQKLELLDEKEKLEMLKKQVENYKALIKLLEDQHLTNSPYYSESKRLLEKMEAALNKVS